MNEHSDVLQTSDYIALVCEAHNEIENLKEKVAALQSQCESYAAALIGERGENAKLRALVTKMEQYAATGEWSGQRLAAETVEWLDGHAVRTKLNATD